MRVVDRYGNKVPCVLDKDGQACDVLPVEVNYGARTLSMDLLRKLVAADLSSLPVLGTADLRAALPDRVLILKSGHPVSKAVRASGRVLHCVSDLF